MRFEVAGGLQDTWAVAQVGPAGRSNAVVRWFVPRTVGVHHGRRSRETTEVGEEVEARARWLATRLDAGGIARERALRRMGGERKRRTL